MTPNLKCVCKHMALIQLVGLKKNSTELQQRKGNASFSQQSTGVLLLHTVYLTIWYISKKWVFYQFIQRFHSLFLIFIVFYLTTWFTIGEIVNPPNSSFCVRGMRVDNVLFSLGWISNVPLISRSFTTECQI